MTEPVSTPGGGEAAIRASRLEKVFHRDDRQVVAFQDLNLVVPAGAFVSVIGPSGCGKTSLLRVVGNLEDPSSGEILVHGRPPREARLRREAGFVFQSPTLLPWRTVMENVRLPGEVFGDSSVSDHAGAALDAVGLAGFEHAYPRELSGGMQSRVSIARALTFRPSLLLMDEPFGALDEITRERMQVELLRIGQGQQVTVLFITHSLSEAALLSDRVVVMTARPGRIVHEVTIPFPRPRDASLRADPAFVKLVEDLRGMLEG